MFSTKWETSRRQYEVVHERNVAIPVRAGYTIDCDVLRPDSGERFPALLGFFPFSKEKMLEPMMPEMTSTVASFMSIMLRRQ